MRPVREWTRADLEALLGQEEGSSLEFKASAALERNSDNTMELVKDVTALANAAGGVIVYGIVEQKGTGVAAHIDDGSDASPEWIEQVLDSNAEPKVMGYHVQRIRLENGRSAFAIDVPQATSFAPHQSKQHHKYFRRYGRKSQPMLDHEVRDLMRRGSKPELFLDFRITRAAKGFWIAADIGNRSPEPALYVTSTILLDGGLEMKSDASFFHRANQRAPYGDDERYYHGFVRSFAVPEHLPIFAEHKQSWFQAIAIVPPDSLHSVIYRLASPGFSTEQRLHIIRHGELDPKICSGDG